MINYIYHTFTKMCFTTPCVFTPTVCMFVYVHVRSVRAFDLDGRSGERAVVPAWAYRAVRLTPRRECPRGAR